MTNNNEELLGALEGLCDEVTWLTYRKSGNKGLRNANLKAIKAIETLRNHLTAPLDEDRQKALKWVDQREEYLLDRIDNGISEMKKSRKSRLKCIATIRQALQQPPAQGWRTIESAPKDGSYFMAYYPFQHNYKENQPTFIEMRYLDGDTNWTGFQDINGIRWGVTHWMPLPTPPKENEDE